MGEEAPIVVGVSGASGAPIAVQVLKALAAAHTPVALVVSAGAVALLREECGLAPEALTSYAREVYSDTDLAAPIASGSRPTRGMVVVPCSGTTAAKIALGLGDTLLTRAAQVHLKERRRLVVVPRETPLPTTLLRHLTTLSELGVVVLDAAPPYYLHPRTVDDQTSYLAGKVLDQFGVSHQLYRGWKSEGA
ncbi:MAG: UbiX family flavin prenyltransferase [Thermoplasmata archaeon]|nr:UbiX family flavin prenyltransferase [Thermoplasmata archaeon]